MCQRGPGIDGLGDHLGSKTRIGAPYFELLGERDVTREAEQHAVVIEELQMLAGIKAIEQRAHTGQRAHVLQIRDADLQATKDPIERVVALDHYLDERQARRGEFPEVIEALTRRGRSAVGGREKGVTEIQRRGGRLTRGVQSRPPQAQAGEGLHQTQRARDRGRGRNRFKT